MVRGTRTRYRAVRGVLIEKTLYSTRTAVRSVEMIMLKLIL